MPPKLTAAVFQPRKHRYWQCNELLKLLPPPAKPKLASDSRQNLLTPSLDTAPHVDGYSLSSIRFNEGRIATTKYSAIQHYVRHTQPQPIHKHHTPYIYRYGIIDPLPRQPQIARTVRRPTQLFNQNRRCARTRNRGIDKDSCR